MKEPIDIFLNRLYTSNDPLCMEAAVMIEKTSNKLSALEVQNYNLALASKYLVESLFEIMEMAKERDKDSKGVRKNTGSDLVRELGLRLKECGDIASDTLKLDTVCKAFEKMRD